MPNALHVNTCHYLLPENISRFALNFHGSSVKKLYTKNRQRSWEVYLSSRSFHGEVAPQRIQSTWLELFRKRFAGPALR